MSSPAIPGYRLGDPALPPAPYTERDLAQLKQALLFDEEDVAALRRAGEILAPQVEALLDVWYGFVGNHDFLLRYFSTPEGPHQEYLARVRQRFGQWVLDTCRAEFDQRWLDYAYEIGRRHFDQKNRTDGVEGAPPFVHARFLLALVYPIYATVRPFLARGESDPATVERMHQAWLKAVLLQAILWTHPYVVAGAW
jgi:hypothetical protein